MPWNRTHNIYRSSTAASSSYPVQEAGAAGRRLAQKVSGIDATFVNGELTYRHGEKTGALPGRLVRATHWIGGDEWDGQ
jgi:N-acyl-D-aspartate/D-glutamate deacylase